ncbi:IS630 family transposase, partial [Pseudoalteromonas shioyasakiensis]|nr:IS630 family transposase [Pseudoalteromonas shioyasakiensis]
TPKHASWLNMVEIEIGNMNKQCLDRRIASMEELKTELAAWEWNRNKERTSINWLFNVESAREKLERAYGALN